MNQKLPIGRKLKKTDDTVTPTEEQQQFEKSHRFSEPSRDTIKEDSQYNPPGPDGLYSLLPRQKSNIGAYRCCMESNHKVDGMHDRDESKGLTRFWCKVCGWDLTLKQADTYMTERMK